MAQQKTKTILITGATRGLGRAITVSCIEAGHRILGCGSSGELVRSLAHEFGAPHDFAKVDVSNDAEVRNWAQRLLTEFGPPDLLLNNAAIVNQNAPLWEISDEDFSRVIDVNIKGVANVIRHFVPAMIARGSSIIVNFSSGWGRSTSAEVAPYCATKWAIEGLTRALAQELPAGMAAIPLNPGIINTEMLQSCLGSAAEQYPDAESWSLKAAPYLLKLSPRENGRPLSAPE
jgi:NAD(P)-dependent dehydrogenase (short-subunit alcohol dehydrogenase family)